jgi:hypothetical protein
LPVKVVMRMNGCDGNWPADFDTVDGPELASQCQSRRMT